MSSPVRTNEVAARSLVEAAAWRSYLTEAEVESCEAFEVWLATEAHNRAAWRQTQAAWDLFGEHATAPELLALRQAALGQARDAGRRRWRDQLAPGDLVTRAIAAGVLLAAVGTLLAWNALRPDVYRTASGERRVFTLDDGSQIALDSRSEVRVRYTDRARDVTLSTGQARFDVKRDVERLFSVLATGQKVVATGTAFNVDLLDSRLLVTLIEGHVVVLPSQATSSSPGSEEWTKVSPLHQQERERAVKRQGEESARPRRNGAGAPAELAMTAQGIELNAGEQLVISPSAPPSVTRVDVAQATAWQSGRLIFENEPLLSVIARVNRYGGRPLRIADRSTAQLRISGVFNTGDVDGFLATITSYLPVRTQQGEDGSMALHHR